MKANGGFTHEATVASAKAIDHIKNFDKVASAQPNQGNEPASSSPKRDRTIISQDKDVAGSGLLPPIASAQKKACSGAANRTIVIDGQQQDAGDEDIAAAALFVTSRSC